MVGSLDALTAEKLLAAIGARYVIADPSPRRALHERRVAAHEAAHAIFGMLRFGPGAVAMASLQGQKAGTTRLEEERFAAIVTAAGYRDLAAMSSSSSSFCRRRLWASSPGCSSRSSSPAGAPRPPDPDQEPSSFGADRPPATATGCGSSKSPQASGLTRMTHGPPSATRGRDRHGTDERTERTGDGADGASRDVVVCGA